MFRRVRCCLLMVLILAFSTSGGESVVRAQPPRQTPAADALATIFNPARAPEKKTMGLLQRSFLEMVEQSSQRLQVALVIDGTDSMAEELAGVQQRLVSMVEDLKRYRGDSVEFSLVVFRDSGSPSGEYQMPLAGFSSDEKAIIEAIQQVKPEPGAPFFHELVDVGIHTALDVLPWSADLETTRWILLFGDAPPYDPTFRDSNFPLARRRYATELLVDLAVRKNVRISSILCVSDEEVIQPYDAAVDETRAFMNALAAGTDGLMLDLSYPDIRAALVEASQTPRLQYAQIGTITQAELDDMRSRIVGVRSDPADDGGPVRIAVVPHLPMDKMSFDPRLAAVQIATAVRTKLASLPGVRVESSVDIERQLRRLARENLDDEARLQALAARLNADYVVWGEQPEQGAQIRSAMYRKQDGAEVVEVSFRGRVEQLAKVLVQGVAAKQGTPARLTSVLNRSSSAQQLDELLAADASTAGEILAAIESLDQALARPAGAPEAQEQLDTALRSATSAATAEPQNPVAQWLIANAQYNLAQIDFSAGRTEVAENRLAEMASALRRAFRRREDAPSDELRREIEADYRLLMQKDWKAAAELYEQTIRDADASLEAKKRAHWMLAGIRSGDWGAPAAAVDQKRARLHIVALLGAWPESPEAAALRRWLRWDDEAGTNRFEYLPQTAGPIVEQIPTDPADPEA